ncbi:MAG: hypothetical protein MR946_07780, partial [Faecalibacterium sp.]|nr:hypothetical protein [Faecalibacterium sp.]
LSGPCILLATAPTAPPCIPSFVAMRHLPPAGGSLWPQAAVVAVAISEEKLFFIERKPENLRIFWLSLFTGKVVEINGILPLSACGRRAAEKMHLTDTARSVKKQFRNDRSRFGTANYKNNRSAKDAQSEAEGILNRLLPADITQNGIPPVHSF